MKIRITLVFYYWYYKIYRWTNIDTEEDICEVINFEEVRGVKMPTKYFPYINGECTMWKEIK